jgi:putative transposase
MLHVVSLAQYATAYTRSWAADSANGRLRLRAENDRLQHEFALFREEIRIKDARMTLIPAQRRPYYPPVERMSILELRAARGWSLQQTADTFLVTATTIASWMKRVDEGGPDALVQIREPVNKFPEFVRYLVQRLKTLCPTMGKQKIAETLARAGLHLATTTVGRMLKEKPAPAPKPSEAEFTGRVVTAKRANHVWHVDLTAVPTGSGFWASWLPWAVPQCWPFCWWLSVVIDHYSRRVMSIGVFANHPDCRGVCAFLGRAIRRANSGPKYVICDRDSIFDCDAFRRWVKRKGIQPPRYGAVGKHGSIAVVERLIRTIKDECTRRILVPLRRDTFCNEMLSYADWHNEHRPHTTLEGRTPNEVYFGRHPANRRPRIEPRPAWPRGSPCARPQALVAGQPGDHFSLDVEHHAGRRHLPIVTLRRAA